MFQNQVDLFLLHQHPIDDTSILPMGDYGEYDHVDDVDISDNLQTGTSSHLIVRSSDGSGMEHHNPEDFPILLPSSFGWQWCVSHGVQALAVKEHQLREAQASDSIHQIRLSLGFKSALFRTQVRPANTQKTKTRAWNSIQNVDTTVHEHARIYSMARDAYRNIRQARAGRPDLPKLLPKDLHVATLILGSEQTGQRNKQQSWIWGFGKTMEDDGTWMGDCKLSHHIGATFLCLFEQLKGYTGSVRKHSLSDG